MIIELLLVCEIGIYLEVIKEILYEKLSQVLIDNLNDFDDTSIGSFIQINYLRGCETISTTPEEIKRSILGMSLELPEEVENPEKVIEEFCSNLTDTQIIEHVVKYEDDVLLAKNLRYFQDIFYLEMKLRRVISFVYFNQYSDDYFNLLRDETTKLTSKEVTTPEQMQNSFENEFFHLLFSQYVNLNNRKLPLKTEDFIKLISERNSYEDLVAELNRKPIADEEDNDLLASLKTNLEPIEKVRNCVAHNRRVSNKLSQNYTEAKSILELDLDNYLEKYKI